MAVRGPQRVLLPGGGSPREMAACPGMALTRKKERFLLRITGNNPSDQLPRITLACALGRWGVD